MLSWEAVVAEGIQHLNLELDFGGLILTAKSLLESLPRS
jgi:hypothetical protein